jgi:hypothetical protein
VLRIPGTLNYKYAPPRPVTQKYESAEFIERSVMLDAIAVAHVRLCGAKSLSHPSIATTAADTADEADAPEYGPADLVKLAAALATLDPDCDEETWKLRRLAPLATAARNNPELGTELQELARSWSSGELRGKASQAWTTPGGDGLTGEEAFDEVWKRFFSGTYTGTPVTLGTIYHDAKQAGWVDTIVTTICVPITPQNDDEVIAMLAAMPTLEYERARLECAKQMDCRPAVLDGLVKAARQEDEEPSDLPVPDVEPSPTPVNPASLLNEISIVIHRFMMGRMSARPLPVSNVSTASLFRSLELWGPTLLIDEADTFMRENNEFKGLINAGHTRANAFVLRTVGDNHEPKRFSVWGAKALAGIALEKHLPDSTMSRAIVINLRRKLPHESVARLRHAEPGLFEGIASRLARLADDYATQVRQARPGLPDALSDRAQDNWEGLLAIAGCAGPDWVRRATAAALKLSSANEERVSIGNELLSDIQDIFKRKQVGKIKSTDLIDALVDDEEKPWATYNRGRPLTPPQLSKMLSRYGIKPKTVRFGKSTPKGYDASQFADAFARYLQDPGNLPQRRNELPESNNGVAECVSGADNVAATQIAEETQEFVSLLGCGGVADSSGDADGTSDLGMPPLSSPEKLF